LRITTLCYRGLVHHWRVNLATVLGVATASTVLTGALLVGDSVRASLRDRAVSRLGLVDYALIGQRFFREGLASEVFQDWRFFERFGQACPAILTRGAARHPDSGLRANHVNVLGVDDRFWRFSPVDVPTDKPVGAERAAVLNEALARRLEAKPGDEVLLNLSHVERVPAEILFGQRESRPLSVRLTVKAVVPHDGLGGFTIAATQAEACNIFVPLATLQRSLKQQGRCNAILVAGRNAAPETASEDLDRLHHVLAEKLTLDDLDLRLRRNDKLGYVAIESKQYLIDPSVERAAFAAAKALHLKADGLLAYLANRIAIERPIRETTKASRPATTSSGANADREVPYSTIAAVGRNVAFLPRVDGSPVPDLGDDEILLNEWTANDLGAQVGDVIRLTYYQTDSFGRLRTEDATFHLVGIVRMEGVATDRGLVPEYEGLTDSKSMKDWDPPFPIDLRRIRAKDEDYWHAFGPTPKAFVSLKTGQRLWAHDGNRFGRLTSIRITPQDGSDLSTAEDEFAWEFRCRLRPREMGLAFEPVRAHALAASESPTDFAMLFLGFSMFLIASASILVMLIFRLGVERRSAEIGLLVATGFSRRRVTLLLVTEGLFLVGLGSTVGLAGGTGYAGLMLAGLRSWWSAAVHAPFLRLSASASSIIGGPLAGFVIGGASIAWAIRGMAQQSPRRLLAADTGSEMPVRSRRRHRRLAGIFGGAIACFVLVVLTAVKAGFLPASFGFFLSGATLLIGFIAAFGAAVKGVPVRPIAGRRPTALMRMAFRNLGRNPRRSLLTAGLVACATFILVTVAANRRNAEVDSVSSGTGGFSLIAESIAPILADLNTADGQEQLNLSGASREHLGRSTVMPFRLRTGDDASCLNLYRPSQPRILGATKAMIRRGGFRFASSLAATEQERRNPWTLLEKDWPDGVVPAIGDESTVTWSLRLGVGKEFVLTNAAGRPTSLRIVGTLSGSVLQGELIVSEAQFIRLFPSIGGYGLFLIETPQAEAQALRRSLESDMSGFGLEVASTGDRLRDYLAIENTYLTVFQTLGGLGIILGALGLAAILTRNVFERRRELAVLSALGYRRRLIAGMVVAEHMSVLLIGLACGLCSALPAAAPHLASRSSAMPWAPVGLMLLVVIVVGALASATALAFTLRQPLLPSLRSE